MGAALHPLPLPKENNMKPLQSTQKRARRTAGFSLAELMVVIVILGLLATLAVQNVPAILRRAFGGTVKANITTICQAVDNFVVLNNGRHPESLEQLVTPDENGETILKGRKVPQDPWGAAFLYDPPMSGTRGYKVYSLGKDGIPGGEGEDMDITNWMIEDNEV